MTIQELLDLPTADVLAMSDADLLARLEPLIPAARAEYNGPRTETITANGVKRPRKAFEKDLAMFQQLCAMHQNNQAKT